ncbi:GlcG/HbpS family heme-binding protein [Thiohalophilus sp.]|uniref:GlcG/HbpS family heme-binding protein n=1 Tax=Thiohalophilus sp. TaxID=3028392 RepID=UPI003975EAB3
MKLNIKPLFATLLGMSLLTPAAVQAEEMTINIKQLKMHTALKIAEATIEQCRQEGVQIAVTVVDRGGNIQAVLRDDLAMDITIPISKQKAHTAMAFNSPLSQMEGRFEGAYSVPKIDGLVISAGGIPINVGGSIMGGIGVSGAPSGEIDEKCAEAGLAAVEMDLQMEGM